jgi:nitrogen fixation protein FixH
MRTHNRPGKKNELPENGKGNLQMNFWKRMALPEGNVKASQTIENDRTIKYKNSGSMKRKLAFKGILLLLLIMAAAGEAWAQGPYPNTGNQTVCITGVPEPYGVILVTGSTYAWTVDGTTTSANWVLNSNGTNLTSITWNTPGVYTVGVLETTALSCPGLRVTIQVTVNPRPTATISGATSVCQNATSPVITFTGANGIAPYTFTYNINGGTNATVVSSGNTATVTVPTTASGTFTYNLVSVADANTPSCSQLQTGSAVVTVNPLPTATISGTTAVCQGATQPVITFTGANGTAPYTFTYNIGGGTNQTITSTGNTATISVPTTTAGSVTYNLVSVQDASGTTCSQAQSGSAVITVNALPTATISGTAAVCQGATQPVITFTGANGTAPYIFTYNIGGGASQTITSTGNTATITVPTTAAGSVTYNLVSVQDASGTTCTQAQTGSAVVTVNPLPTATISGTTAACQGAAEPVITFTGANGTAPYTFTYNIGGGTNQTITSTGNTATISVPTTTAGSVTYNLVSVQDASGTTCSQAQTGSAVITVNALPTATISGTAAVCQGATQPVITFTGANGTAPYIFTYNIGGGASQTITSTGNTATITVPTTTAGSVTYNLVSVQDASGTTCTQAQTGSAVITVNALPTATISGTTAVCQGATQPVITFTGANGTAPYTFTYNIGGGTNQTITSTGNTATISVPTTTAGSVTYNLVSVQDASGTACTQAQTGSAVITVYALPTVTVNSSTVCEGTAATITATPGTAGTYSYAWTVPSGVTNPGNVATFTSTVAGTYTVVITNTTTSCVSAPASGTVTVNPLPTVTVNSATVCDGSSATITATPGVPGTYNYVWTVPAGVTNPGNVATFSSTVAGTYTVVITNTTTNCVSASGSGTITVNPMPAPVIVGPDPVCQSVNGSTEIYSTANTGNNFVWTVVGGTFTGQGTNRIVVTWTTPGAGSVSVTESILNSGCSATDTNNITVQPAPVTSPIYHN